MGEVDGRGQENQKQKKGEMGANETEDKREKYTLHSKKKREGSTSKRRKETEDTSLSQVCLHVCWEEARALQPMSLSLVSPQTSGNLH